MTMKKVYHFLYKTECKITNKYYIGVHSTDNLNDGYLGSGKLILESIKKYGKENHTIEVIKFFSNKKDKFKSEKEFITRDMLNDSMCLNISYGGYGGIQNKDHFEKFKTAGLASFLEKLKNPVFKSEFAKKTSDSNYRRVAQGEIFTTPNWNGKKHTEEAKNKIGIANSIKQKGEKNSQFETCWITNGVENRKIKKDLEIPYGWYKGRKIKK